ncbi:MAG: DUF72 domain-containing protein [Methanobacteriota archaeon]|nr:MAG: DUF72 domain-containing protein [Euryarchaeota archaeon]
MKIFLGTTGWAYSFWKGSFYPKRIGNFLNYYASQSPIVEINSSYYSIPSEQTIKRWEEQTPKEFGFFAKMNKEVTHSNKGSESRIGKLREFHLRFNKLKKLRGILFQFPYAFNRTEKHEQLLETLVEKNAIWSEVPAIVEIRNKSWFKSPVLSRLLDENRIVLACTSKLSETYDWAATQKILYVRILGSRKEFPDHLLGKKRVDKSAQLENWAEKIAAFEGEIAYIFVNNRFSGNAAIDAQKLYQILEGKGVPIIGFKPKPSLADYW